MNFTFIDYKRMKVISVKVKYDIRTTVKLIILSQKSLQSSERDRAKLDLFKQMNQIVIKNIDNFFFLTKEYQNSVFHTKDDLISESYIVLDKCVSNFDWKKGKMFFWYYNKSLTRHFLRVVERNYYKHRMSQNIGDELKSLRRKPSQDIQQIDFTEMYYQNLDLSSDEIRVVKSKVEGVRIQEFLKENKDFNWNKYYETLNSSKTKLLTLKEDYSEFFKDTSD